MKLFSKCVYLISVFFVSSFPNLVFWSFLDTLEKRQKEFLERGDRTTSEEIAAVRLRLIQVERMFNNTFNDAVKWQTERRQREIQSFCQESLVGKLRLKIASFIKGLCEKGWHFADQFGK